MNTNRVLYQIKTLENMILRNLISDNEELSLILTPTQMLIVEYILTHEEEDIYQKDLEDVLNLRRATVSGVLQTMEKNGLLERISHLEDARIKKIILNENAKNIFLKSKQKMEKIEKIVIKNISSEELIIFSKVIDMMKQNLKNKEGI